MRKALAFAACLALASAIATSSGWSDITENFDGNYKEGLTEGWTTETDGWGNPPDPVQITPGRGDTGNAQGLRAYKGSHYVLKTFSGLTPGQEYTVSVAIRTYYADGSPRVPGSSWVEFGWDPQARKTTQLYGSKMMWCLDPKMDFDNNAGNWVEYAGEPFKAVGPSVTVAFKVGSQDGKNGVMAQFDDFKIVPVTEPPAPSEPPDNFNSPFKHGVAPGWKKRFLPGGATPRWSMALGHGKSEPGRIDLAQRLYASTEQLNRNISIGLVKVFKVVAKRTYTLSIWISAADSNGKLLTDPNLDVGPMIKFGVDMTGQIANSEADTIVWNVEPTDSFMTEGNENKWQQFTTEPFETTTDAVSVWLWVDGDEKIGIDAKFDDLELGAPKSDKPAAGATSK